MREHAHATAHVWRSKDKLRCQSSSAALMETRSLVFVRVQARLAGLQVSRDSSASASHLNIGVLRSQTKLVHWLFLGAGNLNSGPQACMTRDMQVMTLAQVIFYNCGRTQDHLSDTEPQHLSEVIQIQMLIYIIGNAMHLIIIN